MKSIYTYMKITLPVLLWHNLCAGEHLDTNICRVSLVQLVWKTKLQPTLHLCVACRGHQARPLSSSQSSFQR